MVNPLDSSVIDFINTNRIAVLAVLDKNGKPHAATVHFSAQPDSLEIYVATNRNSKKCEVMLAHDHVDASVTIGFSEESCVTLQLDGTAQIITDETEKSDFIKLHYSKFPEHSKRADAPETAFIKFTPTWWRFSDYNQKPPHIISSDN